MDEPLLTHTRIKELWPIGHKRGEVQSQTKQNKEIKDIKNTFGINTSGFNAALNLAYENSKISWTTYKANKKQIV